MFAVVRKLLEFESPYISLKSANDSSPLHWIVLQKTYVWIWFCNQ